MLKRFLTSFNEFKKNRAVFVVVSSLLIASFSLFLSLGIYLLDSLFTRSPLDAFNNEILSLAYQAIRDIQPAKQNVPIEDIVVVEMDDLSIEKLGRINQWPRAFDANVISYIASGKPRSINLDLIYSESDSLPSYYSDILAARNVTDGEEILGKLSTDDLLGEAVTNAGCVITPFFDDQNEEFADLSKEERGLLPRIVISSQASKNLNKLINPVLPIPALSNSASAIGTITVLTDYDGAVRNYTLLQSLPKVKNEKSDSVWVAANLSVLTAANFFKVSYNKISYDGSSLRIGDSLQVPTNVTGQMVLNFTDLERDIKKISFYKVLDKKMPAEFFENKIVFVGVSASGVSDLKTTPIDSKTPGVYIHVAAFLNLVNNNFITEETTSDILIFVLIGNVLLGLLFMRLRPLQGIFSLVLLLVGFSSLFIYLIFPTFLIVFPMNLVIINFAVVYMVTLVYRYLTEEKQKNKLKKAFSSYVSAEVVEMISNSSNSVELDGEKKELTVLFSDIRNFTSYSEKAPPQTVVRFLNSYLSNMTEVVFKFGGTIDKFMGDGIMVVYCAPIWNKDHAEKACRSALDMIFQLESINKDHKYEKEDPIAIGVGINTGEMTIGNIGSAKKFDYTVIGDSVNLGARLESLNKIFGTSILVSEYTKAKVPEGIFLFREIGKVQVKGKENQVTIYELIDYKINEAKYFRFLSSYNSGLKEYKNKQFASAIKSFQAAGEYRLEDQTINIYLDLCEKCSRDVNNYTETVYSYN
jgi:adenylate cyclase